MAYAAGLTGDLRDARCVGRPAGRECRTGGGRPSLLGAVVDAGARVLKIERPEGDLHAATTATSMAGHYFVWLNRGAVGRIDFKKKDYFDLL